MILTLPAELEGFIREKVRTGTFSNEEEVICAALDRMREQDEESLNGLEWIRDAVEKGWQSAQAGHLTSAEDFEMEFEEHKGRWRAAHGVSS
jgi:putative addiction module CopG family antidote